MASGIFRNTSLRYLSRSFCLYSQRLSRPTSQPSTSLEQLSLSRSSVCPLFQSGVNVDYASRCSILSYKHLSTATGDPEISSNKKPVEVSVSSKEGDAGSKSHQSGPSDGQEGAGESHETGPAGKPIRGGPVSWLSLLLLITTGAGLLYYYDKEKKQHIEELKATSTAVKLGPSVGKAAIGGPFKLVNHEGKTVTDQDFLGNWILIYFGFTHCPDICPDELIKLAAAVDKIKEKAGMEIVSIFISVDPERDTVEQIGEYVKVFHPRLIGLTGSPDAVKDVARAYRVYYMKTKEAGSDYLVDHSVVTYLMDPNMQFVKFFGKNYDADSLADGIIEEIKQEERKKK